MKIITSILNVIIICASLILISCNRGIKGKWSESDKHEFRDDMAGLKKTSTFSQNQKKFIECLLSKYEVNYSSYSEVMEDEKGAEKISLECSDVILSNGSIKGKWSELDKQKFRDDMTDIGKKEWVNCCLSKCEATYSSYYKAVEKEGKKIFLECNK